MSRARLSPRPCTHTVPYGCHQNARLTMQGALPGDSAAAWWFGRSGPGSIPDIAFSPPALCVVLPETAASGNRFCGNRNNTWRRYSDKEACSCHSILHFYPIRRGKPEPAQTRQGVFGPAPVRSNCIAENEVFRSSSAALIHIPASLHLVFCL